MLKSNLDFYKPQQQLRKENASVGQIWPTGHPLETVGPPNALDREGKASNLKGVSFKSSLQINFGSFLSAWFHRQKTAASVI